MHHEPSRLFNQQGYLPLREYLDDIRSMQRNGPWTLPLGIGDRMHLFFLSLVERFSWFSDTLFVAHPYPWSPAYSVIISYLKRHAMFDGAVELSIRFHGYFSYYFKKDVSRDGRTWEVTGQGVAKDKATALSKSIGEMIERMASGVHDENKNILVASANALMLHHQILYPPKYHRFLEVQKAACKGLHRDASALLEWVQGENVLTGEKTFLPRQMTSWFYGSRNGKELMLHPTTNGSACYFTREGAVLRGLLETVHRDAFLVHWLTRTSPNVVDLRTLPEELSALVNVFEASGLSIRILDITSLPLPSICIVATSDMAAEPQVVISLAAGLTFYEAIRDALQEMVTCAGSFQLKITEEVERELANHTPFVSDIGKTARQLYWRGAERVNEFKWFVSGDSVPYQSLTTRDLRDGESDGERLKAALAAMQQLDEGYAPIVYYPKNRVIERLGVIIAQVYIPKAFPFYLVEKYGTFDSDRLMEFARSKGVASWELNPAPHPFP